ncbi:MAG: hypothetical protein RLZZ192_455, partial [Pseudomonadota bacterium]
MLLGFNGENKLACLCLRQHKTVARR